MKRFNFVTILVFVVFVACRDLFSYLNISFMHLLDYLSLSVNKKSLFLSMSLSCSRPSHTCTSVYFVASTSTNARNIAYCFTCTICSIYVYMRYVPWRRTVRLVLLVHIIPTNIFLYYLHSLICVRSWAPLSFLACTRYHVTTWHVAPLSFSKYFSQRYTYALMSNN